MDQLRELVSKHASFEINTKLELLAKNYNARIIWCPKYHCELNPIEGFWCYLKSYVRRNNDQNFQKLFGLISDSIDEYRESGLNVKLWNRFWEAIEMYHGQSTYQQVLQILFGAKSTAYVKNHKNIKDFNTLLK